MPRFVIIAFLLSLIVAFPVYADINSDLFNMVVRADIAIAKALIDKGADVNVKAKDGTTILRLSIIHGDLAFIQILLDKGAKLSTKDVSEIASQQYGDSYIFTLINAIRDGYIDIVKMLLEGGVNVNTKGFMSNTPLLEAVMHNHVEIVRVLLKNGADSNTENNIGTALEIATTQGYEKIAELLKKLGTKVSNKVLSMEWRIKGDSFSKNNNQKSAIKSYNKAIDLDPDGPENYYSRGRYYNNNGQYDLAIKDLDKAISLGPGHTSSHYFNLERARSYKNKGEYDKAIEDLNKIIKAAKSLDKVKDKYVKLSFQNFFKDLDCSAYIILSDIYQERKQYGKAIENLKEAIKLKPDYAEAYGRLGNIYYHDIKQYDKVIDPLKIAIRLKPDYADCFSILGACYAKKNQKTIAADYFYRAGLLYVEQGGREDALREYSNLKVVNSKELSRRLFKKLYPKEEHMRSQAGSWERGMNQISPTRGSSHE